MTGQYKAYPEYKDSGVEWVGSIPAHWVCAKTAHFFKVAMGQTILKEDLVDDGEWPVFSATEGDHYFGRVNDPNVQLNIGDIVIPARGNSIGAIKLVKEKATTSQTTIYCKQSQRNKIQPSYIYYFFSGERKNLFRFTQTAIPQITTEEIGSNPILIPTLEEQEKIASFLDHQTSKIDNLVSAQESLITLLKEKRQALISHVVTKGLDPNVKMKDSGVEWIGLVPEGWSHSRLKFEAYVNMGQSPGSEDCNEDGIGLPFLQGNSEFGYINPKPRQYCDVSRKLATLGDLLLSVRAPVGDINIADQDYGIGRGLCAITSKEDLMPGFLWWTMHVIRHELNSVSTGSIFEAVSSKQVENAVLFKPSIKEQLSITIFLDDVILKIDSLIKETEQSIQLLKERRAALISAAVTGKIDVRDWEVNA